MREFRSTLPSLLHGARFLVKPKTLGIGDYIITPDMAVERKSIPDLIQSFTSGRLCVLSLSSLVVQALSLTRYHTQQVPAVRAHDGTLQGADPTHRI